MYFFAGYVGDEIFRTYFRPYMLSFYIHFLLINNLTLRLHKCHSTTQALHDSPGYPYLESHEHLKRWLDYWGRM